MAVVNCEIGMPRAIAAELAGHRQNGLDGVVVDQVSDQKQQGLRIAARVPQRVRQLAERDRHPVLPGRRNSRGAAIPQGEQHRNREHHAPDSRRCQADAHGHGFRDAERIGTREQQKIQGEQRAAARVSQRPPARGNRIALLGRSDLRQERVVHHDRRAEADVGDNQQRGSQHVIRALDEEHRDRGGRSEKRRQRQQFLFAVSIIRDRADHRKKKNLARHRNTDQVGIQAARIHGNPERVNESLGIRGGLGERGEIRPQEHQQHGSKERRVRPVVEVPAALFPCAVLSRHLGAM